MAGAATPLEVKPGTLRHKTLISTQRGWLELEEASGRCIVDGCKVKGGGLVRIQETTTNEHNLVEMAWQGKAIVLCGEHLKQALTLVFTVPDD